MKRQFYFRNIGDEICYNEAYFQKEMKDNNYTEMVVYKAIPDHNSDFFFCKEFGETGEKGEGICGNDCNKYDPRNKVSGICRHYSSKIYEPGNLVTLISKI